MARRTQTSKGSAATKQAGIGHARAGEDSPATVQMELMQPNGLLAQGSSSSADQVSGPAYMTLSTLETWLWNAACTIRGPVDAPKFKDYILPLVFLKRLSDVFDDEVQRLATRFGSAERAIKLLEEERARGEVRLVRFYIPPEARWEVLRKTTSGLGELLTRAVRAVARENPRLAGAIDMVDFNATAAGQRIVSDDRLANLIDVLSRHRLGLADVEPDILGRAYEYLLRKFAEGQGKSAGELYTPREVSVLMARLLEPEPGMTVYDPACGSGGLLIKCHLRLVEKYGGPGARSLPPTVAPVRLFGQELNPATFAIARMNAVIHDLEADIRLGDTMVQPAFRDRDGRLQKFDLVAANPMWNQDISTSVYENDSYDRFRYGIPPASTADWGWLQHMLASLNEGGRMAVVLDTGAVSRGSGNRGANRERDIRKAFVEADLVECVILLPENLFYNTTAPGVIMVINRRKQHPGEILLINASRLYAKGQPKNYLTDEHITTVANAYHEWKTRSELAAVISNEDAARNDYNLSPSRYVSVNGAEEVLPAEEALVRLKEAEEERAAAERALQEVLERLFTAGNAAGVETKR